MKDVFLVSIKCCAKLHLKCNVFILIAHKKFYKILKATLLSLIGLKVYLDVPE